MPYSKIFLTTIHPQWRNFRGNSPDIDNSAFGYWIWDMMVIIGDDYANNPIESCWVTEGLAPGLYMTQSEANSKRLAGKAKVNVAFATYDAIPTDSGTMPTSYLVNQVDLRIVRPSDFPITPNGGIVVSLDVVFEAFDIVGLTKPRVMGKLQLDIGNKKTHLNGDVPLIRRDPNKPCHPYPPVNLAVAGAAS